MPYDSRNAFLAAKAHQVAIGPESIGTTVVIFDADGTYLSVSGTIVKVTFQEKSEEGPYYQVLTQNDRGAVISTRLKPGYLLIDAAAYNEYLASLSSTVDSEA